MGALLTVSQKTRQFYSDPTKDPDFKRLQAKWYGRLKKENFPEQEDIRFSDRPLKHWTAGADPYLEILSVSHPQRGSSFPEPLFQDEERFLNHPEFHFLCKRLCHHGNSKLTPRKVKGIWEDYCEGRTIRESEAKYRISDTSVFRVIRTVTQWINLMDTSETESAQDRLVIVRREFRPICDSPFIYSTWRNALWYSESRDEKRASAFYSEATKGIKRILSSPSASIRIACAKDDPDFIAGFAVLEGTHLEFVYVKINYRQKGIAKLLTQGFQTVSNPFSKLGSLLVEKLGLKTQEENHAYGTT